MNRNTDSLLSDLYTPYKIMIDGVETIVSAADELRKMEQLILVITEENKNIKTGSLDDVKKEIKQAFHNTFLECESTDEINIVGKLEKRIMEILDKEV